MSEFVSDAVLGAIALSAVASAVAALLLFCRNRDLAEDLADSRRSMTAMREDLRLAVRKQGMTLPKLREVLSDLKNRNGESYDEHRAIDAVRTVVNKLELSLTVADDLNEQIDRHSEALDSQRAEIDALILTLVDGEGGRLSKQEKERWHARMRQLADTAFWRASGIRDLKALSASWQATARRVH